MGSHVIDTSIAGAGAPPDTLVVPPSRVLAPRPGSSSWWSRAARCTSGASAEQVTVDPAG